MLRHAAVSVAAAAAWVVGLGAAAQGVATQSSYFDYITAPACQSILSLMEKCPAVPPEGMATASTIDYSSCYCYANGHFAPDQWNVPAAACVETARSAFSAADKTLLLGFNTDFCTAGASTVSGPESASATASSAPASTGANSSSSTAASSSAPSSVTGAGSGAAVTLVPGAPSASHASGSSTSSSTGDGVRLRPTLWVSLCTCLFAAIAML